MEKLTKTHFKRGEVIAHVGQVGEGSMIHFEMFTGEAAGNLSQKLNPPWNRRKDLIDPTQFLDLWSIGVPKE